MYYLHSMPQEKLGVQSIRLSGLGLVYNGCLWKGWGPGGGGGGEVKGQTNTVHWKKSSDNCQRNGKEIEFQNFLALVWIMSNCTKSGLFSGFNFWAHFFRANEEHSSRSSQFSVQLCTKYQCKREISKAFLTNFPNELCDKVFASIPVGNWTLWRDKEVVFIQNAILVLKSP